MIIKIYPDLRWEIVDLEWIDPSKNNWDRKAPYSEYDIIREFDDLNYTDRVSNVIFLIKKSSSIKKALGGSKIEWIIVNADFYWRWCGKIGFVPYRYEQSDTTIYNRGLVLKSKCPIPQKDIEKCIISAERIDKINSLIG